MKKAALVILWLGCGLIGAGGVDAHFHCKFKELNQDPRQTHSDLMVSLILAPLGPFSLISTAIFTGFRYGVGFYWEPFPCTEKEYYARKIWCGDAA